VGSASCGSCAVLGCGLTAHMLVCLCQVCVRARRCCSAHPTLAQEVPKEYEHTKERAERVATRVSSSLSMREVCSMKALTSWMSLVWASLTRVCWFPTAPYKACQVARDSRPSSCRLCTTALYHCCHRRWCRRWRWCWLFTWKRRGTCAACRSPLSHGGVGLRLC